MPEPMIADDHLSAFCSYAQSKGWSLDDAYWAVRSLGLSVGGNRMRRFWRESQASAA